MDEFAQMISSVGFPIAACVGMFYMYNKILTDLTIALTRIEDTMLDMTQTLTRVDNTLIELTYKIRGGDADAIA